jgi:hypothetical protein
LNRRAIPPAKDTSQISSDVFQISPACWKGSGYHTSLTRRSQRLFRALTDADRL